MKNTSKCFCYFVISFLIACTEPALPEAPVVRTVFSDTVSEVDREWIRRSTIPWEIFGFTFEEATYDEAVADQRLPECYVSWHLNTTDCFISIIIDQDELSGRIGSSNIEMRQIWFDFDVKNYDLFAVGVHEYGHVLLNSGHLPAGQVGVMQRAVYAPAKFTAADIAFVCVEVGICI